MGEQHVLQQQFVRSQPQPVIHLNSAPYTGTGISPALTNVVNSMNTNGPSDGQWIQGNEMNPDIAYIGMILQKTFFRFLVFCLLSKCTNFSS